MSCATFFLFVLPVLRPFFPHNVRPNLWANLWFEMKYIFRTCCAQPPRGLRSEFLTAEKRKLFPFFLAVARLDVQTIEYLTWINTTYMCTVCSVHTTPHHQTGKQLRLRISVAATMKVIPFLFSSIRFYGFFVCAAFSRRHRLLHHHRRRLCRKWIKLHTNTSHFVCIHRFLQMSFPRTRS